MTPSTPCAFSIAVSFFRANTHCTVSILAAIRVETVLGILVVLNLIGLSIMAFVFMKRK